VAAGAATMRLAGERGVGRPQETRLQRLARGLAVGPQCVPTVAARTQPGAQNAGSRTGTSSAASECARADSSGMPSPSAHARTDRPVQRPITTTIDMVSPATASASMQRAAISADAKGTGGTSAGPRTSRTSHSSSPCALIGLASGKGCGEGGKAAQGWAGGGAADLGVARDVVEMMSFGCSLSNLGLQSSQRKRQMAERLVRHNVNRHEDQISKMLCSPGPALVRELIDSYDTEQSIELGRGNFSRVVNLVRLHCSAAEKTALPRLVRTARPPIAGAASPTLGGGGGASGREVCLVRTAMSPVGGVASPRWRGGSGAGGCKVAAGAATMRLAGERGVGRPQETRLQRLARGLAVGPQCVPTVAARTQPGAQNAGSRTGTSSAASECARADSSGMPSPSAHARTDRPVQRPITTTIDMVSPATASASMQRAAISADAKGTGGTSAGPRTSRTSHSSSPCALIGLASGKGCGEGGKAAQGWAGGGAADLGVARDVVEMMSFGCSLSNLGLQSSQRKRQMAERLVRHNVNRHEDQIIKMLCSPGPASVRELIDSYDTEQSIELGRGNFSRVVKLMPRGGTEEHAIKCVSLPSLRSLPRGEEALRHEIAAMLSLKHDGIVRILGLYKCSSGMALSAAPYLCIAMPMVKGSTLNKLLPHPMPGGRFGFGRHVASQLFDVLAYMHDEGVCHQDVHPDNIMIGEEDGKLTLIDLGCASRGGSKIRPLNLEYAPPEAAEAKLVRNEDWRGTTQQDCWAAGVVVAETCKRNFVRLLVSAPGPLDVGHAVYAELVALLDELSFGLGRLLDSSPVQRMTMREGLLTLGADKVPESVVESKPVCAGCLDETRNDNDSGIAPSCPIADFASDVSSSEVSGGCTRASAIKPVRGTRCRSTLSNASTSYGSPPMLPMDKMSPVVPRTLARSKPSGCDAWARENLRKLIIPMFQVNRDGFLRRRASGAYPARQ